MTVPDYQTLMAPLLGLLNDGGPHKISEARGVLRKQLGLSEEDLHETVASGGYTYHSRLHWAATYMAQAGLLVRPSRGVLQITDRGRQALRDHPERIDNHVLVQFEEFRAFKTRARSERSKLRRVQTTTDDVPLDSPSTPLETIEASVDEANAAVASQLLQRITEREYVFMERLVLRVLTRMGYGGGEGATQHVGRSGDGGVDGVIRQDALGLENIYVQAKRYAADRPVSRPDIQGFVGALHGQQADRGVFITTSRFTADAREYAERVNARVVLIDGDYLTRLMIRYNVGVQDQETFVVKRVDEDFFSDD